MSKRSKAIPDKLYFRIGEVSSIVGVKAYVLRYWESEFPDIHPSKSKSGQRLYKRRDVEMLLQVKELLYDQRFTIDGARQKLREVMRVDRFENEAAAHINGDVAIVDNVAEKSIEKHSGHDQKNVLREIKSGLQECLERL